MKNWTEKFMELTGVMDDINTINFYGIDVVVTVSDGVYTDIQKDLYDWVSSGDEISSLYRYPDLKPESMILCMWGYKIKISKEVEV